VRIRARRDSGRIVSHTEVSDHAFSSRDSLLTGSDSISPAPVLERGWELIWKLGSPNLCNLMITKSLISMEAGSRNISRVENTRRLKTQETRKLRPTGTYLEQGVLTSPDNLLCGNAMRTMLSWAANQIWRISSELPTIRELLHAVLSGGTQVEAEGTG